MLVQCDDADFQPAVTLSKLRDRIETKRISLSYNFQATPSHEPRPQVNTSVVFQSTMDEVLQRSSQLCIFNTTSLDIIFCITSCLPDFPEFQLFHQSSRIASDTAQRLLHTFRNLLSAFGDYLPTTFGTLNLISNYDLDTLWQWNRILPAGSRSCIPALVSARAAAHPDDPAICSWERELSYRSLDRLSTELAHMIFEAGAEEEQIIPVFMEKSYLVPVSWLAVLKTCAAFLLLDINQTDGRLRAILDTVKPDLSLHSTLQSQRARSSFGASKVLVVDEESIETSEHSFASTLRRMIPDAAAYVVFTSGSTGEPKGVTTTHSNYLSGGLPRLKHLQCGTGSRVLDFPPYSSDVSVECNVLPLIGGGCVCILSETERVNDLEGAMGRLKVNAAILTPSLSRLLDPAKVHLDWIELGGEALSRTDLEWNKYCRLLEAYGPSECAVLAALNSGLTFDSTLSNMGRPVACNAWIVDEENLDRLMPIGAPGELILEGPIVGRGYISEPEKTRKAFPTPPPWLVTGALKHQPNKKAGPMYRTGDIAQFNADGSLTFVGRNDGQVKINGQRVELGETETQLQRLFSETTKVVVEAVDIGQGIRPALVAFVVSDSQMGPKPDMISPQVQQQLLQEEVQSFLPILRQRLPQ